MPSLSLLNKIQQGSVDALKALKTLYEKGSFSRNCILMIDEMYLQKSAQHQSGEYVEIDEEGNLHKAVVAFMVVGLKQSIPFVVQAIPEITFNDSGWPRKLVITLTVSYKFGLFHPCFFIFSLGTPVLSVTSHFVIAVALCNT